MAFVKWLLDASGQQVVGSIITSSAFVAAANFLLRRGQAPPSWELSWLVWTWAALIGFFVSLWLLRYIPATPRFLERAADERARNLSMEIGGAEWKRYALADYYMHALVCRNAIQNDPSASDGKLRELDKRLNAMRAELIASSQVLSHDTSLEFTEPVYGSSLSLRARVLQNAEHVMTKAHQKWNAWGGNRAARPLTSRPVLPSR